MSERHRRRHNWEGVVLRDMVERQRVYGGRSLDIIRRATIDAAEDMRRQFQPVFNTLISCMRVSQGIDEWETEGGARSRFDSAAEQGCSAQGVDGVDQSTNRTRIVLHTVNGGTARDEYLQALRRGEFRGTSSGI